MYLHTATSFSHQVLVNNNIILMPKHGLIVFLCNASCSKVNNLDIMVILYKGNFSDSLQLMINATCLIKLSYFH